MFYYLRTSKYVRFRLIKQAIPEKLMGDCKCSCGLSSAGWTIEEHMRALQYKVEVIKAGVQHQQYIKTQKRKRKRDWYRQNRLKRNVARRVITLPVSSVFVSTRTTSSWWATSFTCFGRLGSVLDKNMSKLWQNIENIRINSYYFSTHGWELCTIGAISCFHPPFAISSLCCGSLLFCCRAFSRPLQRSVSSFQQLHGVCIKNKEKIA